MRTRIIGVCVFVLILGTLTWWRSVRSGSANPAPFLQSLPAAQPAQNPINQWLAGAQPAQNNDRQVAARPPQPPAPQAPALGESEFAVAEKFYGTWAYNDHGSNLYFKVSRAGSRLRFELFQKYKDKLSPLSVDVRGADGIYLQVANGQLSSEFVSDNFYPTHGEDFTYRVTLAAEGDDKLSYSVYSSTDGKTEKVEATKTAD